MSGGMSMKRWKPYPAYKDSGVEWLGQVPEVWEVKRLKYICTCNDESLPETTDENYFFQYIDISSVDICDGIARKEGMCFGSAPSRARRIVRKGDSIVSTVRTYLRAIAPIDFDAKDVIVSTGFAVLRPIKTSIPEFIKYYLQSNVFVDNVCSRSTGVSYPAINPSGMLRISVCLPSASDQQAIAAFLDRECARIDALIEKKRRLLELLEEKRRAVITRAVTRGLDPIAPMKDSGVEWLGQVPEEWVVKNFKYCASVESGQVDPTDPCHVDKILIAPDHIAKNTGQIIDRVSAQEQGAISGKYLVKPRQVIYSKIRPALNKLCISDGSWLCSADMYPIAPENEISEKYLFYTMLSDVFVDYTDLISMRVAMPKVNREQLGAIPMVAPPLPEQQAIADYLDAVTAAIDAQRQAHEKSIALLQEYRASLITHAVTGKIDVRDYAPQQ